jgi:hypothetical protein
MRLRLEAWGYVLTLEPHQTREDAPQGAGISGGIPYSELRSNPDIPASKGMPSIVSKELEPYRMTNTAEEKK